MWKENEAVVMLTDMRTRFRVAEQEAHEAKNLTVHVEQQAQSLMNDAHTKCLLMGNQYAKVDHELRNALQSAKEVRDVNDKIQPILAEARVRIPMLTAEAEKERMRNVTSDRLVKDAREEARRQTEVHETQLRRVHEAHELTSKKLDEAIHESGQIRNELAHRNKEDLKSLDTSDTVDQVELANAIAQIGQLKDKLTQPKQLVDKLKEQKDELTAQIDELLKEAEAKGASTGATSAGLGPSVSEFAEADRKLKEATDRVERRNAVIESLQKQLIEWETLHES